IVAATYLTAAAIAGGDVLIDSMIPAHVATVTQLLTGAGCTVDIGESKVRIRSSGALTAMPTVRTMPFPGFPTDAQALLMALATQCRGTTIFIENIFDGRYRHAGELMRMGADIKVMGRVAIVTGGRPLSGARAQATDLRGGAAVTLAALAAHGRSEITCLEHIDRGYECLECALKSLGADIERIEQR
ncbi:MAG: UDP-N-acetylglucosamine 1-carboxyvinyltransferase, partial [Clostridia bacterium]